MNTNPTYTANGIVAAISAAVACLIAFGYLNWTEEQQRLFLAAVVAVLGVVGPLASAWWIARKTTALSNPRDEDGAPLTRSDNSPTIAQVRAAKIRR